MANISKGNDKMGAIPSISLLPIVTCGNCKSCSKKCYANKLCRIYPSVKKSYTENTDEMRSNPEKYFADVNKVASVSRFFRWHVSGDIVSKEYLANMCRIARENKHCTFLCFTKMWLLVNSYVEEGNTIPSNLKMLFSADFDTQTTTNPYRFPEAHVVKKGEQPQKNWKICGGNCSECGACGIGCWALRKGQHICFREH